MNMIQDMTYAREWNESAKYFQEQGIYDWLAEQVDGLTTILELGCGTGQSTLALLNRKHNVIAVDKNPKCLDLAEEKLQDFYKSEKRMMSLETLPVKFVEADYTDGSFTKQFLPHLSVDAIVCWNVGTAGDAKILKDYEELWKYFGYSQEDAEADPAGVYNRTMCLCACLIGRIVGAPVNIVFRSQTDLTNAIKAECNGIKDRMNFSEAIFKSCKVTSLSAGGRLLSINNKVTQEETMDLFLVSVLFK